MTRARGLGLCLGPLVLVAAASLLVSACSPGAEFPSIFPAVHEMPPPRADAPLDQVQIQQATDDLITERNHLTAEVHGAGQKDSANAPANSSAVPAKPQPAKTPVVSQATGYSPSAPPASPPTTGTETT
jgi:hypothetical protein